MSCCFSQDFYHCKVNLDCWSNRFYRINPTCRGVGALAYFFLARICLHFGKLAAWQVCWISYQQFLFAMYPWTYRQTVELLWYWRKLKKPEDSQASSGVIKSVFFLWFLSWVYGTLITEVGVSHTVSKNMCIMSVWSDLRKKHDFWHKLRARSSRQTTITSLHPSVISCIFAPCLSFSRLPFTSLCTYSRIY